jgi:hypothetical protein
MKTYSILIIIGVLALSISFISMVLDPLSLPFPDWNEMPKKTQILYINKSNFYNLLIKIGVSVFFICVFSNIIIFLKRRAAKI